MYQILWNCIVPKTYHHILSYRLEKLVAAGKQMGQSYAGTIRCDVPPMMKTLFNTLSQS